MVWTFGEGTAGTGRVSISVERNGEISNESFDGNVSVREALGQISRKFGIASMNVETDEGESVTPSEAERPLNSFGHLNITPKVVGA